MRPFRVVFHPPLLDYHLRLPQRVENLSVQAFIPQFPVEALTVTVLLRASRLDVQRPGAHFGQPFPQLFRHELRTIVRAHVFRYSPEQHHVRECFDHFIPPKPSGDADRQTLPGVFVDQRQHPQHSAVVRHRAHEVVTPHMVRPLWSQPHQHWHIDVSYLNVGATFYYLCSILDGYSRFLVHWDLRESMTEADIEIILERAKERYPRVKPRIISDNGLQFIAKDFKEFIRISGMTHVRTSPYYPQSNGKIERWHKSLKGECIRPGTPLSLEDARRLVKGYVEHYNNVRLNSAIGYITPKDMLAGHQQEIQADRDRKLEAAREERKNRRQPTA